MKPIGPLMWEHRLIESMIALLRGEIDRIAGEASCNALLIDEAVDFFRTYADRTHHGKEEEILFRDLAEKDLSGEHRRMMEELIRDHIHGRELVRRLTEAGERFNAGERMALADISGTLKELVEFYPAHIEKEDRHFFFPCLEYFTAEEQDRLSAEFRSFDQNMIHEKYRKVIEGFLGKAVRWRVKPA